MQQIQLLTMICNTINNDECQHFDKPEFHQQIYFGRVWSVAISKLNHSVAFYVTSYDSSKNPLTLRFASQGWSTFAVIITSIEISQLETAWLVKI